MSSKNGLGCFLLQILSENISNQRLQRILKNLTLNRQIELICFVLKYYREGTYQIFQQLEAIYRADASKAFNKMMLHLMQALSRTHFDVDKLSDFLHDKTIDNEETLHTVMQELSSVCSFLSRSSSHCFLLDFFGRPFPSFYVSCN